MKDLMLALIRFYQRFLSLDTGWLGKIFPYPTCRFHPTCSQYTYEAVKSYGIIIGLWFGVGRVFRCHPWSRGGADFLKLD